MKFSLLSTSGRTLAVVVLLVMATVVLIDTGETVTEAVVTNKEASLFKPEIASPTTKLKYPVVGTVQAKKEIIIRAKLAGTVEEILVAEGSVAKSGELIALQIDPVLSARLNRQDIQSSITESERQSALLARTEAASLQEINRYQATGLATLTNEASDNRTSAAKAQLVTNLDTLIVSLPEILRFVQDNKTYFTSDSNSFYREAVSLFYGQEPNYLRVNSLAIPNAAESGVVDALAEVTASTTALEMITVANRALLSLGVLANVFTEAETEFLDRNQLSSTEAAYVGYNDTRQSLLALKLALEQSIEALDSVSDTGAVNEFNSEIIVSQSEVTTASAVLQSKIAQVLLDTTGQLSVADRAILEAELSLGQVVAPFAGVVSEVLVEVGEYVQPGTPLFVLVGTTDQEIMVRVPEQFVSRVQVGNDFVVDGSVVGRVDRVVPVLQGGSATVYLTLTTPFTLGRPLRGEIEIVNENRNELVITRRELFFSASGPYVKTSDGEKVSVSIVLDEGETLVVIPEGPITGALLPATGIRLQI